MYGPLTAADASGRPMAASLAGGSPAGVLGVGGAGDGDVDASPVDPQPAALSALCNACGSALWWEDLARAFHCCECQAIPSRRMLRGLWRVVWANGGAAWARYRPQRWDPLGHLVAAECEAAAKDSEGF